MSRYVHEGKTKVTFVASADDISDIDAPTVAELNAGTELTTLLTKDGLQTPDTQNMVDSATLAETFDAQRVGSWGGGITLTGFRDDTNDTLWDLAVYGDEGFLVIRRGTAYATAWAASDDVEVYPIQFHEPVPSQTASNEEARFTVACAVTSEPSKRAVVAS